MPNHYAIRSTDETDLPFMLEMLYEAAAVDPWIRAMGKPQALKLLEIRRYIEGWGREGDLALVAVEDEGLRLGSVWCRLFPPGAPGYGFVAPDTPEIVIGVIPEARGRGVGGALLVSLKELAHRHGYRALSLSVDRKNPALALYLRNGFVDAGVSHPDDTSVTMVASLQDGAAGPHDA